MCLIHVDTHRVDRLLTLAKLRVQNLLPVLDLAVGKFEEMKGGAGEDPAGVLGELSPQLFAELVRVRLRFLGGLQRGSETGEFHLRELVSLLGIEPWAYLKDALQQLAEGSDPATLTPRLWSAARAPR